jgi:hypothetical protein
MWESAGDFVDGTKGNLMRTGGSEVTPNLNSLDMDCLPIMGGIFRERYAKGIKIKQSGRARPSAAYYQTGGTK